MKIRVTIIMALLLAGCCNKKQVVGKNVSLELLNNEIHYIAIDSNLLLNNENRVYEDLKSYTEVERKQAYNLLTFKLVNNSNKKYFFILNTENLLFMGNSKHFQKYFFADKTKCLLKTFFLIDNRESIKNDIVTSYKENDLYKNDSNKVYSDIFQKISKFKNENNYQEFENKAMNPYGGNHYSNSFVIYPGEYKIFKTKLYLPIYEEKDKNFELNYSALIIPPQNIYDFSIGIGQERDFIWNSLLDYQRKEIQDNGYEIFDGVLVSNKVPLKLIK